MQQMAMFKLDQSRSGRGLRCDSSGLSWQREPLLRKNRDGKFEARPAAELRRTFSRVLADEAKRQSRVRSVALVANALNKGDMARAMMTAVLMRLPDPDDLPGTSNTDRRLRKANFNPDEPRDERGQWTTGGGGGAGTSLGAQTRPAPSWRTPAHRDPRIQLADDAMSDAVNNPVALASARAAAAVGPTDTVDDSNSHGLSGDRFAYHEPGTFDRDETPKLILAAAEGEDARDPRFGIGGNYPPEPLIPERLQLSPAGPPIEFLDNFLGVSEPGNSANLEVAKLMQRALLHEIHEVDPNYVYESIDPPGGLAGMSWQQRRDAIDGLRADLAAAIYRVRGDIRPLQEITFDFLQKATNLAYEEGVELYNAGRLNVRLSRNEAIGNYMDNVVRSRLRDFFDSLRIPTDRKSVIRVNRRAYDSSSADVSYRLPDARVGNLAFEVSLRAKQASDAQIKGFFNADFKPIGVVIVRPNQLGNRSSYIVWRAKER
jgi:hypothetical protein